MRPILVWMCAGSIAAAGTEPIAKEWTLGEGPPLPYRWHQPTAAEPGK